MIRISKIYILLLLSSLVFILVVGGDLAYKSFYILLFMFLVSFTYMMIIKHFLEIKVVFNKDYYSAGDKVECVTQINCNAMLPVPYVEIKGNAFIIAHTGYRGEISNITLDENKWIYNTMHFVSRGIYDLGKVQVKAMDLFHIVSININYDADIVAKVYPKINNIEFTYFGSSGMYSEITGKNNLNEDMYQIRDVRKYRLGDSLRRMHWKVSAKKDELYVKNFENVAGEEISLFVDMSKDNYEYDNGELIEESIVDMAVSVISFILSKEMSIKIFLNSLLQASFNISNKEELNSLMEHFVTQKSDGVINIEDYVFENSHRIHRANRIMIITSSLNNNFVESLITLKNLGYSIIVFYCIGDHVSLEGEKELTRWGIECFHIKGIKQDFGGNYNEHNYKVAD